MHRLTRMLATGSLAAIPITALVGCSGGGSGAASLQTAPHPGTRAVTSVAITYPIGAAKTTRARVSRACPPGATCTTRPLRIAGSSLTQRVWTRQVQERLTCNPPGGSYVNPRTACQALLGLWRSMVAQRESCHCALMAAPRLPETVVGIINRHPASFGLDQCSLCGLGLFAPGNAKTLMPTT
jgi:hypothetical protein